MKLIVVDDRGHKSAVNVDSLLRRRGEVTIGRNAGNAVRLDERNVSRRHARLVHKGDGVVLEDVGSSYGVRVNGHAVLGAVPLHAGDVVKIADFDLRVEGAAPALARPRRERPPAARPRAPRARKVVAASAAVAAAGAAALVMVRMLPSPPTPSRVEPVLLLDQARAACVARNFHACRMAAERAIAEGIDAPLATPLLREADRGLADERALQEATSHAGAGAFGLAERALDKIRDDSPFAAERDALRARLNPPSE